MSSPSRSPEAFETLWPTLSLGEATMELALDATLVPEPGQRPTPQAALRTLPPLRVVDATDGAVASGQAGDVDLRITEVLGQGGMGLVQLATQEAMGRAVAVKTVVGESDDLRAAEASLLQEAWVTGLLEHPNIVPVYTVGRGPQDSPLIVMKRIEGRPWREFFRGREPEAFGGADPLVWHIETLMQVCNAVHFAHSRGVIHRDLKPENVMIGAFGEVYLLDWGLAVSTREDAQGRLPLAREADVVVGTPAYMAPEMTRGQGTLLGVHTDVYLLGAILHEIVTGQPPHQGADLYQTMYAAFLSTPYDYGPEVPEELASICHCAMHVEPARRFESADALRQRLAAFLRHRSSVALAREAQRPLEHMGELLEGRDGAEEGRGEVSLYNLFGECRFGFRQALKVWPENAAARRGLQRALEGMASWELRHDNIAAAEALLAELPETPPELQAEMEAARRRTEERAQAVRKLERFRHAVDTRVGGRVRSIAAAICAVYWATLPLVFDSLDRSGILPLSHETYALHSVRFLPIVALALVLFGDARLRNRVNRRLIYGCFLSGAMLVFFRVFVVSMGLALPAALAMELLIYAFALGMLALISDMRLLVSCALLGAGAVAAVLLPDHVLGVQSVTYLLAMGAVAVAWWPRGRPGAVEEGEGRP